MFITLYISQCNRQLVRHGILKEAPISSIFATFNYHKNEHKRYHRIKGRPNKIYNLNLNYTHMFRTKRYMERAICQR